MLNTDYNNKCQHSYNATGSDGGVSGGDGSNGARIVNVGDDGSYTDE